MSPHVHVHTVQDESACIGCKQCVWCASGVFRMEPEYGRSRVFAQWCDTEDNIQVGTPFEMTLLPCEPHEGTAIIALEACVTRSMQAAGVPATSKLCSPSTATIESKSPHQGVQFSRVL